MYVSRWARRSTSTGKSISERPQLRHTAGEGVGTIGSFWFCQKRIGISGVPHQACGTRVTMAFLPKIAAVTIPARTYWTMVEKNQVIAIE